MDNLSTILSNYDDIEFICPIHNLPCIGLCAEFFCNKIFYCMKCIKSNDSCITKDKHELVSFSELLYRFFLKQENKTIDLMEINSMLETIKDYEPKEIQEVLTQFMETSIKIVDQIKNDLDSTINISIENISNQNREKNLELKNNLIEDSNVQQKIDKLLNVKIPDLLTYNTGINEQNTLDVVTSSLKTQNEKDKFISDIKFLSDTERTMEITKNLDNLIYLDEITTQTEKKEKELNEKIDKILNELEDNLDKKLVEIENSIIIPKVSSLFYPNKNTVFSSEPTNLVFIKDICFNAHKTNSIDSVFSAFKSLKGQSLVVWGTPTYSIECYDLGLDKVIKQIVKAHNQTIFSCRHYLDRKGKRDLVITSSYDRSVKVWNIQDDWNNIVNISPAHTAYYIYSVSILCDEINCKNYVITTAPNEFTKVWDFNSNFLREFGVNNESTYFINTYYDYKQEKYYILNANSVDVKSYEFETGNLYKYYKGFPQTWHMSALVFEINDIQQLIESDGNGYIRTWNFHTGTPILCIMTGSVINLRGICIWNEQYLFSTGSDSQVKLYDLKKAIYVKGFLGHTTTVCAVDKIVHPKYGECLISHALDGKLKLWGKPS
jgi:WD40 repeat protein